jgi:hypothetical protein
MGRIGKSSKSGKRTTISFSPGDFSGLGSADFVELSSSRK